MQPAAQRAIGHARPAVLSTRRGDRHRRTIAAAAVAVAAALSLSSSPARATTRGWIGSSGGYWNNSGNWSPSGVPAAGDVALINLSPAADFTVNFNGNYSSGAGALGGLTLNSATYSSLTFDQYFSSFNLYTTSETVGNTGQATYVQSAGTNALSYALYIGNAANSSGTYSLTGTGSLTSYIEFVGDAGGGYFEQSGGTHAPSNVLYLAYGSGSSGAYDLSSSGLLSVPTEYVGVAGAASFTQFGGTHSVSSALDIAATGGSSGSYALYGGTLTAAAITLGGSPGASFGTPGDAYGGTATFGQYGGTSTVSGDLNIGYKPAANCSYTLVQGSLSVSGNEILSNDNNSCTFTQAAPSTHFANFLLLANGPLSRATYGLTGGVLTASTEVIGGQGAATFTQSGGTHSVSGSLFCAYSPGSSAAYILTGGSLSAAAASYLGGSLGASGGSATLSLRGGSATFGPLKVWNTPGTSLVLAGATLSVSYLDLSNNPALLQWTAGTLNFLSGYSINSAFPLTANITLSPAMTLSGSAASTNSGTINLAGGTLGGSSLTNNSLIAGYGAISTSSFSNPGTLLVAGGTLNTSPAFGNAGLLLLNDNAANLTGSGITNTGSIQGHGKISNPLTNSAGATIEPTGGTLAVAGPLTNASGATLRIAAGNELLVTGSFPTNAGSILLTGGTLDTASHPLTNSGFIQIAGGTSTVSVPLTNASGAKTIVSASGTTAVFNQAVTNVAGSEFRVSAGASAVFFAPVTGAGAFTGTGSKFFEAGASEPAFLATGGDTTVDAGASLTTSYLQESSLTANAAVALAPNSPASSLSSLTINAGGSLDVANDRLTVGSIVPDTLRAYLAAGSLFSSTAQGDPQHLTALGYSAPSPSTLIRLTYLGDANLDGKVNADDYALVDRSLARHTADAHWADGDFNYDGVINSADYLLIDRTFLLQGAPLEPAFLSQREAQFGPGYVSELLASVPEPSLLGVALMVPTVLRRRRGHNRKAPGSGGSRDS